MSNTGHQPPSRVEARVGSRCSRTLFIYDGQCGFCRRWIERWRQITGEAVEYQPYQVAEAWFPQIPRHEFRRAAQLIEPDGTVYTGAEAVYRSLAAGGKRRLLWAYKHVPGFGPVSRVAYQFIADRRYTFSRITDFLWGRTVERSTYVLTRSLFLRLLGVVYLIAFASMFVQVRGLVGERGILPVGEYLQRIDTHYERIEAAGRLDGALSKYHEIPTLCWLDQSDAFLQWGQCGGGMVLSALLILGLFPTPMLILLWALYLSVTVAGQDFLHFQWDILLLETGLLAIFFAPMTWRLGSRNALPPSRLVLFLIRCLLFKLMFLSGITKLLAGDPTWQNLEALNYHYWSQPLPTWTAWYVHYLGPTFHAYCTAAMFVIEMGLPFLIFAPRRLRYFSCAGMVWLMFLIGATGNYNFFNLLTAVLCLTLLDDQLLRQLVTRRKRESLSKPPKFARYRYWLRSMIVAPSAVIILALSAVRFATEIRKDHVVPIWRENTKKHTAEYFHPCLDLGFDALDKLDRWTGPLRSISSYGLFRRMTKSRPEIIIEGSNDGHIWVEYEFKWKPGDMTRRPGFVEPHQPRVDWQMWFAALNPRGHARWMLKMMQRMQEGVPEVLAFFGKNPFPDEPPKFLRAVYYDYEFTDWPTHRDTGAWWTRSLRGVLIRPMQRPSDPVAPVSTTQ